MNSEEKLSALRAMLEKHSLDAYLQPVHDEYMSEYPPACNQRVEWLCGFSGSAGILAVTRDNAALFVDGRYTLQAGNEIDAAFFEWHNSADRLPETWLVQLLAAEGRIGYDPKLFTQSMIKRLNAALEKKHITLAPCDNLVDAIWKGRPRPPASALFAHDIQYAGENAADKRKRIGESIAQSGADAAVINAPDSVCWLLNIRAHDVECSPFLLAPMIVDSAGRVQLFVEPSRADAVMQHLGNEVTLSDPSQLGAELAAWKGKRIACDPTGLPIWFTHTLKDAGAIIVDAPDPCQLPKAIKNELQLQCIRNAHIRDGAAIAKLLCWLEGETEKHSVTEMEIADALLGFRKENEGFHEPSFNTIAGSGPHGAIVHYRATEKTNRVLGKNELLLLDSGGQYPDGTTDITRTVAIGTPTAEHKDRFTRVLKGHIAIATAKFPAGTNGSQLDALARQYLWQEGLDYDHGTGHGVGQFLCVHEGPQRISKRAGDAALLPGMILSNEPGYYKAGEYGIRIENLVAVVEAENTFLGFETLTCAPIDSKLVDAAMLTPEEKAWLNTYHAWVENQLYPLLGTTQRAWLKTACAPV